MEFGNKLPINYKLKKLKAPVYLLSIYDDKTFYKVIKVACNNEDHITEYENYKVLLKDTTKYNVENFYDYIIFENIDIRDNIDLSIDGLTINIPLYSIIDKKEYIDIINSKNLDINLYILIGDYFPNNKTLDKYILNLPPENVINIINKVFINLDNVTKETNFRHGDFKGDNILIRENDIPSLFDLEFSLFIEDDKYIEVTAYDEPTVNLYLNLKDGEKIYGSFLKIFDIYLLVLSIVYKYNTERKVLVYLRDYMNNNIDKLVDLCDSVYIFWIIYINIILYLPTEFNDEKFIYYANYKNIKYILLNPGAQIEIINKELLKNQKIIDSIDFIKKNLE
uniref:Protein kinase domain-containing protein n=1 Tax=viral metagenome TaxID=1070528 RepID=A0A6C0D8P3_9ZZZZ